MNYSSSLLLRIAAVSIAKLSPRSNAACGAGSSTRRARARPAVTSKHATPSHHTAGIQPHQARGPPVIVVDTNLIGYLYLESKHSPQVEHVLRQDADWVASLLWRSEFRNVLARYLRKQWLSLAETRRLMDEALRMMEDREYEVDSNRVLRLVADSTCSAYDCEFVALAQELGTFLVTLDKEILKDFPTVAVSVDTFLSTQT